MDEESGKWVMGDVVCGWMTIVWCGVPSGGSQGHSSWWHIYKPTHLLMLYERKKGDACSLVKPMYQLMTHVRFHIAFTASNKPPVLSSECSSGKVQLPCKFVSFWMVVNLQSPQIGADWNWITCQSALAFKTYWLGCFLKGKQKVHTAFNVYKIRNKPVSTLLACVITLYNYNKLPGESLCSTFLGTIRGSN